MTGGRWVAERWRDGCERDRRVVRARKSTCLKWCWSGARARRRSRRWRRRRMKHRRHSQRRDSWRSRSLCPLRLSQHQAGWRWRPSTPRRARSLCLRLEHARMHLSLSSGGDGAKRERTLKIGIVIVVREVVGGLMDVVGMGEKMGWEGR